MQWLVDELLALFLTGDELDFCSPLLILADVPVSRVVHHHEEPFEDALHICMQHRVLFHIQGEPERVL